jgi:hypothetical protein
MLYLIYHHKNSTPLSLTIPELYTVFESLKPKLLYRNILYNWILDTYTKKNKTKDSRQEISKTHRQIQIL